MQRYGEREGEKEDKESERERKEEESESAIMQGKRERSSDPHTVEQIPDFCRNESPSNARQA